MIYRGENSVFAPEGEKRKIFKNIWFWNKNIEDNYILCNLTSAKDGLKEMRATSTSANLNINKKIKIILEASQESAIWWKKKLINQNGSAPSPTAIGTSGIMQANWEQKVVLCSPVWGSEIRKEQSAIWGFPLRKQEIQKALWSVHEVCG